MKINTKETQVIKFIKSTIPSAKNEKSIILAFEKIDKFTKNKISLYDLPKIMKESKHPEFKNFDSFFKTYCNIIIKEVKQSKLLKDCLFLVNENQFRDRSKKLNPKYYHLYSTIALNYDTAFDAYMYTMSKYDANKSLGWACFWSLISTKNGILNGVYLGDTVDCDYFWGYVQQKKLSNAN